MNPVVLNAEDVGRLLPIGHCIDIVADAMEALSSGAVSAVPRLITALPQPGAIFAVMPGMVANAGMFGAKLVSALPGNAETGLPVVQGLVLLFDAETGRPSAIVDGGAVTAIRTAAASGLATRLLAREDATSCGVLGAGEQAAAHISAICAVRPIEIIKIWARTGSKASAFVERQRSLHNVDIIAVDDPASAAQCDIVCTVTGSRTPILAGEWVRPGAHVNLVGAHEASARESDSAFAVRACFYVDETAAARAEAGDILIPITERMISWDHVVGELGQLVSGVIPGRTSREQITAYKSLGVVAQDLFAARAVLDAFRELEERS